MRPFNMDCCTLYSEKFNAKDAQREIRDYRLGKIKKNSRPLIQALTQLNLEGASLLDIGGGVGVLVFELVKKGISHATLIELSEAYLHAFREECIRQGLTNTVVSVQGDYTMLHSKAGAADLVCLDKVICCYADYVELVSNSCRNAKRWYAYVIPRDVWWVKLVAGISDRFRKLTGDPFQTFVHPQSEIEKLVMREGFHKLNEQKNREWLTVLYERN
jgi:cyclopropane fatty-acyl-phospholipid synthase-like methyltransferase